MPKPNQSYTVIREYESLYGMEELIRRILRSHIGVIQEEKDLSEWAQSGNSHGK